MQESFNPIDELKVYFSLNKVRGKSYLDSSFSLLDFLYQRHFKKVKQPLNHGNIISGYQLYRRPLLISYSRSGTNWIRYIIEFLSRRPTPGNPRLVDGANYFIDRAHAGYLSIANYDKAILILRNYKECLVRHHGVNFVRSFSSVMDYLETSQRIQRPDWYIRNIEAFEQFQGKKMVLYYEDMLTSPELQIRRLATFLNLGSRRLDALLENLQAHKQRSVLLYRKQHDSVTVGDSGKLKYHSRQNMSLDECRAFDDYYRQKYPELFQAYLARYQE